MKILTVIGARPQFIKAATLSRVIRERDDIEEVIVHTGQHFDNNMSSIFFEQMDIPEPDYNLNINSLNHGAMTGRMLAEIEKVLLIENPNIVVVYGDTNSTIAGALAAKKIHIPVAHIEAGLRSYNMDMPEEINRILTDKIADFLFCPTDTALYNLMKEGFDDSEIFIDNVGDVMLDAALFYAKKEQKPAFDVSSKFILATVHRAENTNDLSKLKDIISALNEINSIIPVIIPLHPRTRNIIEQAKLKPEFTIVNPVGYLEMIYLLKHCSMVLTDSGGLQKEAFFFKKFCITMREQTEWVELVENKYNKIVGSNKDKIIETFHEVINRNIDFDKSLYGDGEASSRIIQLLNKHMK